MTSPRLAMRMAAFGPLVALCGLGQLVRRRWASGFLLLAAGWLALAVLAAGVFGWSIAGIEASHTDDGLPPWTLAAAVLPGAALYLLIWWVGTRAARPELG